MLVLGVKEWGHSWLLHPSGPWYSQTWLHPRWHGSPAGEEVNYPVWMVFCIPHSSKSLGSTLTSVTFKYTHTTSHHPYFESLGSLGMYLNLKPWQSINIWTHSWCLCLLSLKHHFFSPELTYSNCNFFPSIHSLKWQLHDCLSLLLELDRLLQCQPGGWPTSHT